MRYFLGVGKNFPIAALYGMDSCLDNTCSYCDKMVVQTKILYSSNRIANTVFQWSMIMGLWLNKCIRIGAGNCYQLILFKFLKFSQQTYQMGFLQPHLYLLRKTSSLIQWKAFGQKICIDHAVRKSESGGKLYKLIKSCSYTTGFVLAPLGPGPEMLPSTGSGDWEISGNGYVSYRIIVKLKLNFILQQTAKPVK